MVIEVKTQTVGGSVDEKLPFIVFSMLNLHRPTGLLIAGDGFRPAAIEWAEDQQTDRFFVWRDVAKMRNFLETGVFQAPVKMRKTIKSPQRDIFDSTAVTE